VTSSYEYAGIIHCHSVYSDGTGTFSEIIEAARQARLDFLLMTDHDTLEPLDKEGEGWRGGLLLLIGAEVSPLLAGTEVGSLSAGAEVGSLSAGAEVGPPGNHYLVAGVRAVPPRNEAPQSWIDRVRAEGGIGFIAHPHDRGNTYIKLTALPWKAWDVQGFDGIEVWNYSTAWSRYATNFSKAALGVFFPRYCIPGPEPDTLAKWDELTRRTPCAGIGGVDAHALRVKLAGIPFIIHPYRALFRAIVTHIILPEPLTGDFISDKARVLGALRQGSCYIANWEFGRPSKFAFQASHRRGVTGMGGRVQLEDAPRLEVSLPWARGAEIRLLKDGRALKKARTRTLRWNVSERGVYRIEVHRRRMFRWRPWIYSNPIAVE